MALVPGWSGLLKHLMRPWGHLGTAHPHTHTHTHTLYSREPFYCPSLRLSHTFLPRILSPSLSSVFICYFSCLYTALSRDSLETSLLSLEGHRREEERGDTVSVSPLSLPLFCGSLSVLSSSTPWSEQSNHGTRLTHLGTERGTRLLRPFVQSVQMRHTLAQSHRWPDRHCVIPRRRDNKHPRHSLCLTAPLFPTQKRCLVESAGALRVLW